MYACQICFSNDYVFFWKWGANILPNLLFVIRIFIIMCCIKSLFSVSGRSFDLSIEWKPFILLNLFYFFPISKGLWLNHYFFSLYPMPDSNLIITQIDFSSAQIVSKLIKQDDPGPSDRKLFNDLLAEVGIWPLHFQLLKCIYLYCNGLARVYFGCLFAYGWDLPWNLEEIKYIFYPSFFFWGGGWLEFNLWDNNLLLPTYLELAKQWQFFESKHLLLVVYLASHFQLQQGHTNQVELTKWVSSRLFWAGLRLFRRNATGSKLA